MEFSTPAGRLESLHSTISEADGTGFVLVAVHDYPDPDCLAAALGVSQLLSTWQIESVIGFAGGMGRPENKAMVGLLEIPLTNFADISPEDCLGAILVDTQPGAGNNPLPSSIAIIGVIDHHAVDEDVSSEISFKDVRPDFGSTSTIIYGYLIAAGAQIDQRLATALLLGIITDTNSLMLGASESDIDAYGALMPEADLSVVNKVRCPLLLDDYFQMLSDSLINARKYGEAMVVDVGEIEIPDLLSSISELMVRAKNIAWVLALGYQNNTIFFSLRICPPRRNAVNILRKTIAEEGRCGGHGQAAGGQIPVTAETLKAKTEDAIIRFLQAVGTHDEPSRQLVR